VKNKYAGVTLDWHDDELATLKAKFPTADQLPDIIKEADIRPAEKLANEQFALVALDAGNVLRKYACHDPGTTAMSVIYFMEHGDKLPEGAQKMAAANLVAACQEFDLAAPVALEKAAGLRSAVKERARALAEKLAGFGSTVAKATGVGAGVGALGLGGLAAAKAEEGERLRQGLLGAAVGAGTGAAVGSAGSALGQLTGNAVARALAKSQLKSSIGGLSTPVLERLRGLTPGTPQFLAELQRAGIKLASIRPKVKLGFTGNAMPLGPGSPMGASPMGGAAPAAGPSPSNGPKKALYSPVARIEGEIEGMKKSLKILGVDQGEKVASVENILAHLAGRATGAVVGTGIRKARGVKKKSREEQQQEALRYAKKQRAKGVKGYEYITEEDKKKQSSVVDITGQSPKPKVKLARPQRDEDYAVVLQDGSRHYPIDTWDRVKLAEDYYQENRLRMEPRVRRQYAVKLAAKAIHLGYPLDYEIFEKGACTYAKPGQLKAAIEMRKVACAPGEAREWLDELFEKRAYMEPGVYASCLHQFDVENNLDRGWDRVVLDPWESTFGINKTAEVVWEQGADRVTDDQLQNLAQNQHSGMDELFTHEVSKEFIKDPVGIFNSMPDPQKKIIARLANDLSSQGGSEVAVVG
jgi:hypothetical protein